MSSIIGEGHTDFNRKATQAEREATKRAQQGAGVVSVDADWERRATPAQREARRQETLKNEKKNDQELYKTLSGEIRAKYKIEVTFIGPDEKGYPGRTSKGPNRVGVTLWESGKLFNGGGDELMYWCMSSVPGIDAGCGSPFSGDFIRGGMVLCPNCKRMLNAEAVTDKRSGSFTNQNLAKELVKMFYQLNSNADIYLKYHKTDIHYIAMEQAEGPDTAARLKGLAIYPLKNIFKDIASGADLGKRFNAFLSS